MRPISIILFITFLVPFLTTHKAHSEVFRWPKVCEEQILVIENKTIQQLQFWLQHWDRVESKKIEIIKESSYYIAPKSKVNLTIQNDLFNVDQDFSLLQLNIDNPQNKNYQITSVCIKNNIKIPVNSVEGGVHTYKLNSHKSAELILKNLSPTQNKVTINQYDLFNKLILSHNLILHPLRQSTLKINTHKNTHHIKIQSHNRFNSYLNVDNKYIQPEKINIQKSNPDPMAVYFNVGSNDNQGDQFIIKITDPHMIKIARKQLTDPNLHKIIFAEIETGHQDYNRNMKKNEKSFWSWSVSKVTNISDFGSTSCNGFPQLVEDLTEYWVQNPGKICFWNYRIKQELHLSDVMNP